MKSTIYYQITLCLFLSIACSTHPEIITIPKTKLDQVKLSFKKISPVIFKIGQSKIPNTFGKDIDAINQVLNARELSDKNIETVLSKLNKIKSTLLETDQATKVSIQTTPGRSVEQSLGIFLATTYKKLSADLKVLLDSAQKITTPLSSNNLKLIRDSFKPLFWGFYDLYEHSYYKYLGTVRTTLHGDLNKEKLGLIKDIMELLLADLNDENQNQTMMLETISSQKFNLTIRDFKELIKTFINNINALIK